MGKVHRGGARGHVLVPMKEGTARPLSKKLPQPRAWTRSGRTMANGLDKRDVTGENDLTSVPGWQRQPQQVTRGADTY